MPKKPADERAPADTAHGWDPETIELLGEFMVEAEEGLDRVDRLLVEAGADSLGEEGVDELFRVFHSIKGGSGFLGLASVTALAHETESLLSLVRRGSLELSGPRVEAVFEATEVMRELLEEVREGLRTGVKPPRSSRIDDIISAIAAAKDPSIGSDPAELFPLVEDGERLGDILSRPPVNLLPEDLAEAVSRQARSGKKLGEELVEAKSVSAKEVSRALRAQAQAKGERNGRASFQKTIKVDLNKVDALVEMIGELVIVESMLTGDVDSLTRNPLKLRKYLGQFEKITRDLQDVGMRMRMVPVQGVFQKMSRMVRELSRKSGKKVDFETSGATTEMDRSMVEQIADPLVHMIRNAMDHGIESEKERKAAGKDPRGRVRLCAYHEGGSIVIELRDDGRGLDKEALLAKAKERGLIKEGDQLSEQDVFALIFHPGFSTAKEITEISGRGVGMDVVKKNIDAMRGRVSIESRPGEGTAFKIVLPLTLAIIDGMLVACGEQRYIVPTLSIVQSVRATPKTLSSLGAKSDFIEFLDETLPVVRLSDLLGMERRTQKLTEGIVMVVEGVGRRLGLFVDEVLTQNQVVIRSLGDEMGNTELFSGAAIMSDGKVGLILNVEHISAHMAFYGYDSSNSMSNEFPRDSFTSKQAVGI